MPVNMLESGPSAHRCETSWAGKMIKYSLICENDHEFETWFQNGKAYDDQLASGDLACPVCASGKISKSIMAPNLGKKSNAVDAPSLKGKSTEVMQMMNQVREHVESNFDYVGDKFASEARAMHYGDSEERDIYGESTLQEAEELFEEGIPVAPVPGVPEKLKN